MNAPAGAPRTWRWVQYGVTAALLAVLAWLVDWKSVVEVLRGVHPAWAVTVVVLVFLERAALNVKWRALVAAGGLRLGFWKLFRIQLGANALGTFLPSSIGVDALRIGGLWQYRDLRAEITAATLLDRLTTVFATVAVGGLMLAFAASSRVGDHVALPFMLVGGLLCVALCFCSRPGRELVKWGVRRSPRRLRDPLMRTGAAAVLISGNRRAIAVTVCSTAVVLALRICIGVALFRSCGVDVPLVVLATVVPAVWGVSMLPISIGGLGVQDLTYVAMLSYAGVAPASGLAVSLLDHVLARTPLLPGLFFWRDVVPARAPGGEPQPAK